MILVMDDNSRQLPHPLVAALPLVVLIGLLVVVIALIAGSAIGGLAGMLIAVPTAAFLKVQLERWLVRREMALEGIQFINDFDDVPDASLDDFDEAPDILSDTGLLR